MYSVARGTSQDVRPQVRGQMFYESKSFLEFINPVDLFHGIVPRRILEVLKDDNALLP